ncbi:MAG: Eco57I restriction-modification methylase domain-containing protein [Ruminococcus sp.]|nr:Eco57I restriction-modification methylase domain-containing protein [Ruminococcus sp.]
MEELIKLDSYPIRGLVGRLLQDKTTRKNILFASDSYADYGDKYKENLQMTEEVLLGFASCDIQPRAYKATAEQTERTRKRAEVFTPAWIVNQMNNHCDAEWFGRPNVFNHQSGQEWTVNTEPIEFPKGKNWKQYVDSRRLEITCGEAPYIVSRYDTATGEIIPLERRIGILDRKLRIVNENAADEDEWFKWAFRAFQSVYGYEYQGDNLLIARMNLLYTLADYIEAKWHRQATQKELEKFLNVICWNFWQMDGIKDTVPLGSPSEVYHQMSLFGEEEPEELHKDDCKIYDWRGQKSLLFRDRKEGMLSMKFDFVIGNPPYQETTEGTSDKPIYDIFMSAAFDVGDKVCLITPARFLFNAGKTPKAWNEKMLKDEHFKVLLYEQDSSLIFKNTDIKGGVAITYRDAKQDFGAIFTYTHYKELNNILKRVLAHKDFKSLDYLIYVQNKFDLDVLYSDYPDYRSIIGSGGKEKRLTTSIFSQLDVFEDTKSNNSVKILGLIKNNRVYKYILRKYLQKHENLEKYKVILPKSNGSGAIGEVLSTPLVGVPLVGYTQSFISIGAFDEEKEANACLKYIKSKFARTMLGVLKITQDNNKDTWKYVPLQDFTSTSDIDWSKSIPEIDQQLYKKYNLTPEEIKFIETHVKEME